MLAEQRDDLGHRMVGEVVAVGARIGDQTMAAVARVHSLVKILRQSHGVLRIEAEQIETAALQTGSGERRVRRHFAVALLVVVDQVRKLPEFGEQAVALLPLIRRELALVHEPQRFTLNLVIATDPFEGLRNERGNVALGLRQNGQGWRDDPSNPAGRRRKSSVREVPADDLRDRIADLPIDQSPGDLRIDAIGPYAADVAVEGLADGLLGDFAEGDP